MTGSKPHKCPVCDGKGRVTVGFYPDALTRTECRACEGKGIVWGWESQPVPYVPLPYPVYPQPTYPWRYSTTTGGNMGSFALTNSTTASANPTISVLSSSAD